VLFGLLQLSPGQDPATLIACADKFNEQRKRTQPPGASLGSMFKNPPGDFAGRLIEAAGLKRSRVGGVVISPIHANFFVNIGGGTSSDYLELIRIAQGTVHDQFGVDLELEIELIGEGFDEQ
jgi:UDP-N-acetylmuramate dehydrogenase